MAEPAALRPAARPYKDPVPPRGPVMRLAAVSLIVLAGLAAAAPPPEVAALQKHVHQVIDGAEPSIACVLVSRSEHYADFRQGPSAAAEGRLGDFRPPTTTRFVDAVH